MPLKGACCKLRRYKSVRRFQLASVRDIHAAILRAPLLKRGVADPVFTTCLPRSKPCLALLQYSDDLLFSMAAALHRPSSSKNGLSLKNRGRFRGRGIIVFAGTMLIVLETAIRRLCLFAPKNIQIPIYSIGVFGETGCKMYYGTPFWRDLERHGSAISLIDGRSGQRWTYAELAIDVDIIARELSSGKKKLLFVPLDNKIADVIFYLGVLASGHVPFIYSEQTSKAGLEALITRYKPDLVVGSAAGLIRGFPYGDFPSSICGRAANIRSCRETPVLNDLLALLISTSGSAGSAKLVRLSSSNLNINAVQICQSLQIGFGDRAITSLPLSYVYGLSVLHSHLSAGASVVVDARSVLEKEFWNTVREQKVTSFGGVPWTYQMLKKICAERAGVPLVEKFTAAGGKFDKQVVEWMVTNLKGARIYLMYGQTEASARIAVLPPELINEKMCSVGRAVPGGKIECAPDGTVIYSGPNVMLGYANSIADLCAGDELCGRLDTGDLGYVDSDGYLFLSGRKSRICKVYGVRINLDEILDYFQDVGLEVRALQNRTDEITVRYSDATDHDMRTRMASLASRLGIPKSALSLEKVEALPRLFNGKMAM